MKLRSRGGTLAALAALLLAGTAAASSGPPAGAREHDVKAVFLFRFLQFIEWPTQTFASTDSPIVIGILGADPFGDALDGTVRDERVDTRPIVVRRGATLHEVLPCHLLFVPGSAGAWSPPGLPGGPRDGMLLVGETPGFLTAGGMINFYMLDNQVRFEICPDAAERAGIRIRSRLLRLARIVACEPLPPP